LTEAEKKAEAAKLAYKKAMDDVKAERKVKAQQNKEFRKAEITVMWVVFRFLVKLLKNGDAAATKIFNTAFESLKVTDSYPQDKVDSDKKAYALWSQGIAKK
jgi:hypothetical protein